MKLLITTQAVDSDDPFLSFFIGWLEELSPHYERIEVICLKEGTHVLPLNVFVHSLGKEGGRSRIKYIWRFYRYIWSLRKNYDSVLVHMNQEYVILGWKVWFLTGKKVYLWRNHQVGNFATSLAVFLSTKVFCTSKFSYTAQYKKAVLMPVGVDTDLFRPLPAVTRAPLSILFFARLAPAKRPDMLLQALGKLHARKVNFRASIYGTPLLKHEAYANELLALSQQLGLSGLVRFEPGQRHLEAPSIFSSHQLSVNLAQSGMYDKTLFEAAACGCLVLACSRDFAQLVDPKFVFAENDVDDLANKIEALLGLSDSEQEAARENFLHIAQNNSLKTLAVRLAQEIQ